MGLTDLDRPTEVPTDSIRGRAAGIADDFAPADDVAPAVDVDLVNVDAGGDPGKNCAAVGIEEAVTGVDNLDDDGDVAADDGAEDDVDSVDVSEQTETSRRRAAPAMFVATGAAPSGVMRPGHGRSRCPSPCCFG